MFRRNFVFFDKEDGTGTGVSSTEDNILDGLDLGPDEGAGDADPQADGTPTPETTPQAGGEPTPTQGVTPELGVSPVAPIIPTPEEQIGRAVGTSKEGHLVDANGKVVASAGKERRLYEGMHNARREEQRVTTELATIRAEHATLTGQVQAFEAVNTAAKQFDLQPDESLMAMQLVASYKKDPIATLKYMLTEAKAAGHNIEGIGDSGLDMSAVGRMLDEKLSPILQDREALVKQDEFNAGIKSEVQTFFTAHPDAVIHENAIAGLINKDNTLSIREAYLTLQMFAQQRGLNWGQDLQPQLTAQINAANGGTPIPSGRAGTTNVAGVAGETPVASENDSFDNIVKASMQEAGMNIE